MSQRGVWSTVCAVAGLQLLGAEFSSAAAKNCQTAADCGGAPATCELFTYQTCAGADPACPAGSPCGDKPTMDNQTNCAPYVEGICRQPYELPCKVDVDCGTGFRCVEQIGQACMGWGMTGGVRGPAEWHEECHETRGTFACELIEKSCSTDRDCAAGLRCLQSEVSACGGSVAMTDSPTAPQAESPAPECAKVPMLCAPDGYFGDLSGSARDGDVATDDGVADTGGATVEGAPAADGDNAADELGDPAHADEGCSLADRRGRSLDLGWLAIAGALVIRRRRRIVS